MKVEIKREYWGSGQIWLETPCLNGRWHGLSSGWYKNDLECGARIKFDYGK